MTYISWSIYVEGPTDAEYLKVIIPRTINSIIHNSDGPLSTVPETPVFTYGIPRLDLDQISGKICEGKESFHLLFVHGDTGGRALAATLNSRTCALCEKVGAKCDFPNQSCIVIAPNRETEAWTLADLEALRRVFGLSQAAKLVGIPNKPTQVEHIADPKLVTSGFLESLAGGRKSRLPPRWPYESIAQEQRIELLLQVPSFKDFNDSLRAALRQMGHPNI